MKKITFISVVYFSFANIFLTQQAQWLQIEREKNSNNHYEINISYDNNNFYLEQKGFLKKLKFYDIESSLDEDIFAIPIVDFFIALPSKKIKSHSISILSSQTIDALPELNKKAAIKNGKLYFTTETIDIQENDIYNFSNMRHIEIVEYFWLGYNYCAHIKFRPFVADTKNKTTRYVKNFSIKFYYEIDPDLVPNLKEPHLLILNKNLASNFQSRPLFYESAQNSSWIDFSQDYLKIATASDLIYRIYKSDLIQAGIDAASINPKTFQMFLKGSEIEIYVSGEDDGIFDDNDYIEFVGLRNMGGNHRAVSQYNSPYNEYLDRYSDTTIYFLTWGKNYGKRVAIFNGSENLIAQDTLEYYHQVEHAEFNQWFDSFYADITRREMPFWTENKTWFWGILSAPSSFTYNFSLSKIYPNKTADLYFKGQSQASNITTNAHWVAININAPVNDTNRFNKYQTFVIKKTVPTSQLINGNNTFRLVSYANGNSPNGIFMDWFEVEYPRYPEPINGILKLFYPYISSKKILAAIIQNISTNNFSIWKYGDGYRKYLPNINSSTALLIDTLSSKSFILFCDTSQFAKPKIYGVKRFKNLLASANKADYIAITHKKFYSAVLDYCYVIEQIYNVKTITIDVEDIYDEFAFGFFNPEVIKDFLKGTQTYWQTPSPQYVALIGEANYDYHYNKVKFRNEKLVYNYVPSFGAPVSDSWFGMWNNQKPLIPQIKIGRLPIREISELYHYRNKIINTYQRQFDELNKQIILFSGGNPSGFSEIEGIRATNNYIKDNFINTPPLNGNTVHFYKTTNPSSNFGPYSQDFITKTIEKGAIVIGYIGHSGTQTWDNSITTVEQLENKTGINPLITDFGCSTARFAEPDIQSFSELFVLHPRGQAIAYIGNSSLGYYSSATTYPKYFFEELFKNRVVNLAQAHIIAKQRLVGTGISSTYNLFAYTNTLIGDPIVNLKLPDKTNLNISLKDIKTNIEFFTDNIDAAYLTIKYFNFGLNFQDTFKIKISHFWNDTLISENTFVKITPGYEDSIVIPLSIKNKAGEHKTIIFLDSDNKIDEIYENDNQVEYKFVVASTKIRDNIESDKLRAVKDEIIFINPQFQPKNLNEKIRVDIAHNENFNNFKSYEIPLDTFYTRFNIQNLDNDKFYYIRAKINSDQNFSLVKRFYKSSDNYFLFGDSLAFSRGNLYSLIYKDNALTMEDSTLTLEVLSAGYHDGNTANILLNKQQLIPENTLRGHHVVLIDKKTLKFFKYLRFDIFKGGVNYTNYNTFLDTVSNKYIVAIAISDEGSYNLDGILRNKLKNLGSLFADSISFRSSWCMIGMKGLNPGEAIEQYKKIYEGPATVDTSFIVRRKNGKFITPIIENVFKWKKIEIKSSLRNENKLLFNIYGFNKISAAYQLISQYSVDSNFSEIDISQIDFQLYTKLYFSINLISNDSVYYPSLQNIKIYYHPLPELGLNYQTVFYEKDTVQMRDRNKIFVIVSNASNSTIKNIKLKANIDKFNDNRNFELFSIQIDSLISYERKKIEYSFDILPDFGSGRRKITLYLDPLNEIQELFEDNNIYNSYFYIKPDTTFTSVNSKNISVLFDGKKINDGDFVSPKPSITIEINNLPYWFKYRDTASIYVFLNDRRIYYSEMNLNLDSSLRKAIFTFKPNLNDGQHTFSIYGININGQINALPAYEKTFKVESNFKVYNIYNYPNPFSKDTYFTFELTQPADLLKLKIFTISGRFLQEIVVNQNELNRGLNKIYWNGLDRDQDNIANGVYFYKLIFKYGDKTYEFSKKMAKVK